MLTEKDKEEMRILYKQAKYKDKQVSILSELYLVSKEEVSSIVGFIKPTKRKRNRG